MDLMTMLSRAKRGLRDDLRLHIVAVASLVVAFLCLGGALLAISNLSHMASSWGQERRVSIYLRDGASEADIAQLRLALEGVTEIASAELIPSDKARELFAAHADLGIAVESLPPEAFPASLELTLKVGATSARVKQLADRVGQFAAVDAVETYQSWFSQLAAVVDAGGKASIGLALLVIICVIAVVGNTIRLAVAGRRQEIEVLKLCGATDGFVRGPFVMEGAMQSGVAAFVSVVALTALYAAVRGHLDATLRGLFGVSTVFVPVLWLVALVVGSVLIGALGSYVSLRRYLSV